MERPLRSLPIPKGHWRYSPRFLQVRAAKSWGLTPSQFDALPRGERAWMIAEMLAVSDMEAFDADQRD